MSATRTIPASITLHEGDYGSQGTIVLRVHRSFSVNSELKFAVKGAAGDRLGHRPRPGRQRCRACPSCRQSRRRRRKWLTRHGYPNAVLQEITADTEAADRMSWRRSGMSASAAFEPPPRSSQDRRFSGGFFWKKCRWSARCTCRRHAFAMVPARDGRQFLVTGWRIRRPMEEWSGATSTVIRRPRR